MANIDKIIGRVRKMLALADNAGTEEEAALAASRAAALMAEYQLDEAMLRLDDATAPAEPIDKQARLEPDAPTLGRKRVAWRETLARATATSLGVKMYFWSRRDGRNRKCSDIVGCGRESAIQTWRYTFQYLCRTVDELAEAEAVQPWQSVRAYRNAFRVGCAQRISERIYLACEENKRGHGHAATMGAETTVNDERDVVAPDRTTMALAIIEHDREEVDREYAVIAKDFGSGLSSIGQTSNRSGYDAGRDAGERVKLTGARAGLPAGQGRLKGGR